MSASSFRVWKRRSADLERYLFFGDVVVGVVGDDDLLRLPAHRDEEVASWVVLLRGQVGRGGLLGVRRSRRRPCARVSTTFFS